MTCRCAYYSDYYPYGSALTLANNDYRYGYQGQFAETDKESAWVSFGLRMYDPVVGRWMTTDPYGQYHSPYVGMGNDPVNGVDPDGGYATWLRSFFAWMGGGSNGRINKNTSTGEYYILKSGVNAAGNGIDSYRDYGKSNSNQNYGYGSDWLSRLQRKDGSIGQGFTMFANNGILYNPENRFRPDALYRVDNLGDMTLFFNYAGQLSTNAQIKSLGDMVKNPLNSAEAVNNLETAYKTLVPNSKFSKPALTPTNPEPRKYVDPVMRDTVTEVEALRRQKARFGSQNWSNWIHLNVYEWKY